MRVVRAMPNTPALIGAGAAAICAGAAAGDHDLAWAEASSAASASVVRAPERLLDAVTGLSGSGPAYVFVFLEALADAGVRRACRATRRDARVPDRARRRAARGGRRRAPAALGPVTSPGGTTVAGLHALEAHGVRAAFPRRSLRRPGARGSSGADGLPLEREQEELGELARREVVVADENEGPAAVGQPRADRHALDIVERDPERRRSSSRVLRGPAAPAGPRRRRP